MLKTFSSLPNFFKEVVYFISSTKVTRFISYKVAAPCKVATSYDLSRVYRSKCRRRQFPSSKSRRLDCCTNRLTVCTNHLSACTNHLTICTSHLTACTNRLTVCTNHLTTRIFHLTKHFYRLTLCTNRLTN